MNKKEARKYCNELKPQFNIGKEGITQTFIKTIDEYLQAHEIVKIKVLIATNRENLTQYAEIVSNHTNSNILQKIGFTFVLYREKNV